MKFFFKFGSCCRSPKSPETPEGGTNLLAPHKQPPGSGKGNGRSLDRACNLGNRPRVCSSYSAKWRPKLSMISEDGSVSGGVETSGVRTGKVGYNSDKVRELDHADEYRKASSMSMVFAAFSATSFMF